MAELDAEALAAADAMAEVGRDAVARGLTLASGGNLSVRLAGERFIITAAGSWLDRLRPADFVVLDLEGRPVAGSVRPSSEWKLHQRAYAARDGARAIVHVHPQRAVLLDALGHRIRLLTLDHAYYVRSIGTVPFFHNGTDALADAAAAQALEHDCILLRHHGCSTIGDSIEMAYRRALNLEEAAEATYAALLLGDRSTTFPPEAFASLHHR